MAPKVSQLTNRRVDLAPDAPGLIAGVAVGSLGDELGLQAGDRIISIDGRPVVDFITWSCATRILYSHNLRSQQSAIGSILQSNVLAAGCCAHMIVFSQLPLN